MAGMFPTTLRQWLVRAITAVTLFAATGALAQTYSSRAEPYSWIAITGHTTATYGGGCTGGSAANDDDITAELPLGFTFTYGATAYTTARIMTNGRLQFNNTYCETYTGPNLPSANLLRTMRIYGEDLDPSAGGSVKYNSSGVAPNRRFVVTWTNVPEWNRAGSFFNLQLVLHENGDFVYQFGSSGGSTGVKRQIGWELTTSDYALYSFSSIGALASTAIRWYKPNAVISGTVFEDVNYGGGAGRSLAASSGVGVSGATVELYNSSGTFVSSTPSGAGGAYSFTVNTAGTYYVRVASSTVLSTRSGSGASLRGVMSYRTNASSGTAVAVTDFVGGTNPAAVDPGIGSSGTTFNTSSFVFSAGLAGTAHAVTPLVATLGTNIGGIDFGFNFDTVVNTNDAGQGSLRQAVTNANALGGDSLLSQNGRAAGIENLVFMISNGTAAAGLRSSLNYFSGGAATVAATSALPTVSAPLVIDAQTQPGWNAATFAPILVLNGAGVPAGISGLVLGASGSSVRGLAIVGFSGHGISVAGSGASITGNWIGLNAAGAAVANGGSGIFVASGVSGVSVGGSSAGAGNVVANNGGAGIALIAGAAAQVAISGNSHYGNGGLGIDLGLDGVSLNDGTTSALAPNQGMDHPVFLSAGISAAGTSMTVSGYVGIGTGQAVFAGARIEIFKAAADASGFGEGRVYLGALTADANGQFNGSVILAVGMVTIGDTVTATATSAGGHTSEFGPNLVTTPVASLAPATFEAFDTSTAAGATSGPLRTRVAGAASSFDIVALAANGSLHPGFTGSVALSWLDARNNSGVATGSCRASWLNLGSAGTAVFAANARVSTNLTPPATATRVMRLMMSYTSAGVTTTACSGDAFAAIPATLSLAASDLNSSSAGSTRALANTSAGGGVVHQAGRPFTLTATARDATGAVMSGYDGTPTLAITGCVLPGGCTAGALSYTPSSAVAGNYSNASVTYAEVGAITLQLSDPSYADIDAADTAAASRQVNSITANAGRFVPDSLLATLTPTPRLATANAACLAAGSGATFFGQGFGWASAPQVTITARNAAGATTLYWSGALMKLNAASGTPTLAASGAGSATLASSFGALGLVDLGNGQARFTASSLDRFLLDLPAATVQASLTPALSWTLNVSDNSESGVSGNTSLAASATQAALTFDAGGVFHSGRLALSPAHGDARVGLRLLMELQRYTSAGWVTMTEDRGCVTVQPRNLGVESPSGVFASSNVCAAPLAANVSTRGGRAWLPLPGTPNAAPGRLALRLAGAAAGGNSCAGLNTTQALSPLNLPWLLGGNSGAGPLALASWGRANRDAVLRRETW